VDIFDHSNQKRYPGQKISFVLIEGYAYLVPFVESEEEIFLKTIIPEGQREDNEDTHPFPPKHTASC
jgi:hypothetical protein